ncbi:MAG: hypothetical protein FJY29_00345 [Betaproteobacteria bacterium]|nr:hypothetical protein [Betaproteobacteria bacterium]
MKINNFIVSVSALAFSAACVTTAQAVELFSGKYKVNCTNSPQGCACVAAPNSKDPIALLLHAQPVDGVQSSTDATKNGSTWVELKAGEKSCYYPAQNLRPIYWESDLCPDNEHDSKIPMRDMVSMLSAGSSTSERIALGNLFPTFYNIADESYHPGPKTNALYEAGTGNLIARVSKSFHEDLDMEGTGTLIDGRVLNVANRVNGVWDYKVLPRGAFGIGILNHNLHPYRSVAVDFVHLCKQAKLDFCSLPESEIKKRLIGALMFMPRLQGIALPNGKTHDGYVCAQDVGGAIELDRVDIFVGPLGGGNPYLKECRYANPFNVAGVKGLVPFDWRTYENNGVDATGTPRFRRTQEFEYRTYAAHKALDTYLVKGAFCKP